MHPLLWSLINVTISATVLVTVAEIAGRYPRLGALLLTLPIVSILAFIMTWSKAGDMGTITQSQSMWSINSRSWLLLNPRCQTEQPGVATTQLR